MQQRDEDAVGELKPWHYGSSVLLVSREGRMWHAVKGKGGALDCGREANRERIGVARRQAKHDFQLRRAEFVPNRLDSNKRPVVRWLDPLPLVFEEDGRLWVRFVQPLGDASHRGGSTRVRGRIVRDPLPLHGDRDDGWVTVRDEREGLIVLHAPSLAAQLFGISARAD